MNTLAVQTMRLGFKFTGLVLPRLSGFLASEIFLRPRRIKRPGWEQEILKTADWTDTFQGLRVWHWGQGPKILLVHGWDGRGSQLGRFVEPLVKAGFSVLAFDGPAHGDSRGVKTNMWLQSKTIEKLSGEYGPFHGIVAHSFGGGATLLALHRGLAVPRAMLIATPSNIRNIFHHFAAFLNLESTAKKAFQKAVERQVGVTVDQLEYSLKTPNPAANILLVHDKNDHEVPFASSLEIQKNWAGAELMEVSGVGHRQILKSASVLQKSVEFFKTGNHEPSDGL